MTDKIILIQDDLRDDHEIAKRFKEPNLSINYYEYSFKINGEDKIVPTLEVLSLDHLPTIICLAADFPITQEIRDKIKHYGRIDVL